MIEKVKTKVYELESQFVNIRRHLHQHPELSGEEVNTSKLVHQKLQEAGFKSEILNTEAGPAVIAYLYADNAETTVAIRADMDALPVLDKKNVEYASKIKGKMHACGHDFHTTSVLGTAMVLAGFRNNLGINVKFIFQPAEEGSNSGAKALVKAGIMDDVDAIFTLHARPDLEAGKVGIKYGSITSAIEYFKLKINGKGGHSSRPDKAIDSIFITTQIINSLYTDIPRSFSPNIPIVITVGRIQGGTVSNVIAEECIIEGTIRTSEAGIREKLMNLVRKNASGIAERHGATVDFEFESGSPPVVNDNSLARLVEKTSVSLFGEENTVYILKPNMGAEDFARYLDCAPGMLIEIGTGGKNSNHPLHSCLFDIDEKAISVAVSTFVSTMLNFKYSKQNLAKSDNIIV